MDSRRYPEMGKRFCLCHYRDWKSSMGASSTNKTQNMSKHKHSDINPPIDAIKRLTLNRTSLGRPLPKTQQGHLPTWGQIKKLTQGGERILGRTHQEKTSTNLFLAMVALVLFPGSIKGNFSYWVYIPNPTLNRDVHWGKVWYIIILR